MLLSKKTPYLLYPFMLSALILTPNSELISISQAGPCGKGWLSRLGCTLDPTNPRDNGSFLQSTFHVSVKNNTRFPIRVTARYMNYFKRGVGVCSTLDGGGEKCPDEERWAKESWNFAPGENALVITTALSRYMYFSASSFDGRLTWKEKQVDMGPNFGRFQHKFDE